MRKRRSVLAVILALGLTCPVLPAGAEDAAADMKVQTETVGDMEQNSDNETEKSVEDVLPSDTDVQSGEEDAKAGEADVQSVETDTPNAEAEQALKAAAETQNEAAQTTEITIYHTNDTHGYLQGDGESVIGLPLVAGLKKADQDAILVDAGDATQGLPLASMTKGNDVIQLMNLAGYDLMAAGNHEFDFGTEAFLKNVSLANFPVLAANIYKDGKLLLEGTQDETDGCHVILEREGKKIGFFGLTTRETATATNPEGIQGLTFADEIETAKAEIQHLEEAGADVVIAVAHLGDETAGAPCTSADLANGLTGEYQGKLDAIIDGHSHTLEDEEVNDVQIVQTGTGLASVGKLTVKVREEGDPEVTEERLDIDDFADVTPDAVVEAELIKITKEQSAALQEKIGMTPTTLWAGWLGNVAPTRFVETNYGDLAADAIADAAKTMVAKSGTDAEKQMPVIGVENGGGIREMISNGDITKGDLVSTFPFSNTIYMKKITPKTLYEIMEQSGSSLDGQDPETGMLLQQTISGGFLQISGFRVVFNPDAKAGSRVVSITLDGQSAPLDRNDQTTQIIMAGNNYIMSGGSDYSMLADIPKYAEAGGELETIEAYVADCLKNGALTGYQGTDGRIAYTGSVYQPKDYTAMIQIVDESGNAWADREISYRVDGGEGQKGMTDKDGILHVTVADGGHGIRVSDSQGEAFVDNYTGLGIQEDAIRTIPQLTAPKAGEEIPVSETEGPADEEESGGNPNPDEGNPPDPDKGDPSDTENTDKTKQPDKENKKDTGNPQTGDDASVVEPAVLLVLSGAVIVMTIRAKRK